MLRAVDDGSVVAGLSDVCTGATQHVAAARECRFAHRVLAARGGPARTLAIGDLGTYRLLAHVADPEVGRAAARNHLDPLLEPDASDRGELLHTLRTYLAHDRRGTETARALHVHVNTLRYRVQRIEELLGVSFDDADTRSSLQLALHLWDLPTPPAGTRSLLDG